MTVEPTNQEQEAPVHNSIQVADIQTLLKAIEIAYNRNTYSEFEIQSIQEPFDRAKVFLAQFVQNTSVEEETPETEE